MLTEGKPDPPQNLSITGFTESTVGLKWEPTSKKAWTKVDETQSLELTASKLTQGTESVSYTHLTLPTNREV